MELEFIASKCLAKNASERYKDAADITVDLSSLGRKLDSGRWTIIPASSSLATTTAVDVSPARQSARSWQALPWTLAGVLAIVAAGFAYVHFQEPTAERLLSRFSFTPDSLREGNHRIAAVSPNGRHIAFVSGGSERMLWVLDLDSDDPRFLAGTKGARPGPFWSPDSRYIAFATSSELRRIAVEGGPAAKVCDLPGAGPSYTGGAWSKDGKTILLSAGPTGPRMFEVSAAGGSPTPFPLEVSSKGPGFNAAEFLPEGSGPRGLIYNAGNAESRDIFVKNLENGESSLLVEGSNPVYSPSGHVVYQESRSEARLWALPFSLQTLQATGVPFVVVEGGVDASVAVDGTLVYTDAGKPPQQLAWRDRKGDRAASIGQPHEEIAKVALSPNGARVAVAAYEGGWEVWIHQVNRSIKQRLTVSQGIVAGAPVWSPSGAEIAYRYGDGLQADIFVRTADGGGEPLRLGGTGFSDQPTDWSRDGDFVLYTVRARPETGSDLSYLKRVQGGKFDSVSFLQSSFDELGGQFSPDGRFVAYCSNESGRYEVYVRQFPSGSDPVQVSANGGCLPLWNENSEELFYVEDNTLMAAQVSLSGELAVGTTEPLFSDPNLEVRDMNWMPYDVAADGRRFVLRESLDVERAEKPSIHIVQNWYEEFRERE
jgi:Tol biopolymer transport system component